MSFGDNMIVKALIVVQAHLAVAMIGLRAWHWNLIHWHRFAVNSFSFRSLADECNLLVFATNFFNICVVISSIQLLIVRHAWIHTFWAVQNQVYRIKLWFVVFWDYWRHSFFNFGLELRKFVINLFFVLFKKKNFATLFKLFWAVITCVVNLGEDKMLLLAVLNFWVFGVERMLTIFVPLWRIGENKL